MRGRGPYYFVGVNLWCGMNLGATNEAGDRERLVRELDHLGNLGVTDRRVMAATEGPASEPWRAKPVLQPAPGVCDEDLLRGLDFLLAEAEKRNMRVVMVLNNRFRWSGGMAQYVKGIHHLLWAYGPDIFDIQGRLRPVILATATAPMSRRGAAYPAARATSLRATEDVPALYRGLYGL